MQNLERYNKMFRSKFMNCDLMLSEDIFTPRPETELLVNVALYALHDISSKNSAPLVLDIGTGSGNIAISLTKFYRQCKLIALDIKKDALDIAKTNADLNGVSDRIEFVQSDVFKDLSSEFLGKFDCIVSNPPYVARWEIATLQETVQNEPRLAIDGGEDGLDFYKTICFEAGSYLVPGGFLIMEMGYNQSQYIKKLLVEYNYSDIEIYRDDSGIDRVIKAVRV